MNDVTIIDRFLDTFSRYIDSGFGLLQGEVAFLTATLIVIDMTIAGLYWAMSHATGQGEDVIAKLLRKVLYVGAFAYIIGNFNWLASIVFRSFAGLGITATGSAITMENFLQPGRLAKTGIDAAAPILDQIGDMAGFPEVFVNLDPIVVLFIAWLVVILCFFVLAVQLFITLIEFKLTTLAGFVLIPFALWNKTNFLAEKVLGNVVSSGIKVLVLAVIVGIGSGLFAEFQVHPDEPSIDHALVVMLASLALLALGIFGPGVATGLVSGAPQLGAGAMAGAAVGAVGTGVAIGAAATGVGGAVAAGARMAPGAAKLAGAGARAATSAASSAKSAFQAGSAAAGGGAKGAAAGLGNVAKTG
ncbi:TPA: P-type conjugative transfer protein TrbL, partial [Pseudomonas aeruginosa]|nr:P-type conjugative transfer protein TrbL [Pseudomonas aeruginosa]